MMKTQSHKIRSVVHYIVQSWSSMKIRKKSQNNAAKAKFWNNYSNISVITDKEFRVIKQTKQKVLAFITNLVNCAKCQL